MSSSIVMSDRKYYLFRIRGLFEVDGNSFVNYLAHLRLERENGERLPDDLMNITETPDGEFLPIAVRKGEVESHIRKAFYEGEPIFIHLRRVQSVQTTFIEGVLQVPSEVLAPQMDYAREAVKHGI